MRKIFLLLLMIFLGTLLVSYEYDYNDDDKQDVEDIDSADISFLAEKETVWFNFGIHSPVDTYSPAIKFNTRFILNKYLRLAILGSFYNEAIFKDHYDNENGENYKSYDWNAIKNFLEVYLGWKVNDNIHLGFMFGGGVDIDKYYKNIDIENDQITEEIKGNGFVKTGVGLKLNSEIFNNKLSYFFINQFFDIQLNGNGSVGIENYEFGNPLNRHDSLKNIPLLSSRYYNINTNPSISYDWASHRNSSFKYFGFQTYGEMGIAIPLNKLINVFSIFDNFEILFEMEHKIAFKYFNIYEYYDDASSDLYEYNIKSHFAPSGIALFFGVNFRPIDKVGISFGYKPNFIVSWTEWMDDNGVEYKDYLFNIVHQIEILGYFKFPKVVTLKIGTKYYIKQQFEYQYEEDNNEIKASTGGGGLSHELRHFLEPVFELGFIIVEEKSVESKLTFIWNPKIILYNAEADKYEIETTGTYILDANILNLANWKLIIDVKFDPEKMKEK